MLRIYVGTNTNRTAYTLSPETTLRAAFETAGVNYEMGTATLDGSTLQPGDLDKSFADFGITGTAYLLSIVKANNA